MVLEHQVICADYNHKYTSDSALYLCYEALSSLSISLKEIPLEKRADKHQSLESWWLCEQSIWFLPLCSLIQVEF